MIVFDNDQVKQQNFGMCLEKSKNTETKLTKKTQTVSPISFEYKIDAKHMSHFECAHSSLAFYVSIKAFCNKLEMIVLNQNFILSGCDKDDDINITFTQTMSSPEFPVIRRASTKAILCVCTMDPISGATPCMRDIPYNNFTSMMSEMNNLNDKIKISFSDEMIDLSTEVDDDKVSYSFDSKFNIHSSTSGSFDWSLVKYILDTQRPDDVVSISVSPIYKCTNKRPDFNSDVLIFAVKTKVKSFVFILGKN